MSMFYPLSNQFHSQYSLNTNELLWTVNLYSISFSANELVVSWLYIQFVTRTQIKILFFRTLMLQNHFYTNYDQSSIFLQVFRRDLMTFYYIYYQLNKIVFGNQYQYNLTGIMIVPFFPNMLLLLSFPYYKNDIRSLIQIYLEQLILNLTHHVHRNSLIISAVHQEAST